ncbi:MAG TPA: hypothetical protein PLM75_10140 [bacterium]|nr:hypothetical protein [bacterium]
MVKDNIKITEEEAAAIAACLNNLLEGNFKIKKIKNITGRDWKEKGRRAAINTNLNYSKYWR